MSKKHFKHDDESSELEARQSENLMMRPPDEDPYPPYDDPPYDPPPTGSSVSLNQVSPIAGSLAGGISITLTGSGFQPGAAVYFGSSPATQVTVESGEVIRAVVPASSNTGSVSVSVINPDGSSAALSGGFTYVTSESGQQAEVIGVTPLAVIEDTTTVISIRGRNLIAAYNEGLLALRGPSRCQITFWGTTTSHDAASGIDTVNMTVNVQCTPALQSPERMAVQVLASRRAEAASDGVVESSRQMFTVLPKAVPVILAYTANLNPGTPNLVMVSGRNLDGHSLSLDDGTEVAFQTNDGNFLTGIVTLPENVDASSPLQLSMLDAGGTKVAEYQVEIAPDSGYVSLASEQNFASPAPSADELAVNLTAAPNQQFIGPTANDSAAFSVQSGSPFGFGFNFANFAFTILDVTIILPIINEVYMIPHFDGGIGEDLNSPVLAEVGKIFRLRGAGLLVAIRVEVEIRIQVVLIIGFYYRIWDYGFYNEFPEFGWSIGSMVIGIQVHISVIFRLAALAALVKPDGQLKLLASFSFTVGFDFFFDSNGTLRFRSGFRYRPYLIGITPKTSDPLLCEGKFELLRQNGEAAVADEYGFVAQYAVHDTGICCLPWDFDVRLLRYDLEGREEVVQEGFQTSHCVTAVQPPAIEIKPTLAYLDTNGNLVPATDSSGNEIIERLEPHETKREYVLAAKVTSLPAGINKDVKITFPAVTVAMTPGSPLSLANGRPAFPGNRNSTLISDFFTGNLVNKTNLTLTVPNGADLSKLYAFTDGTNKATIAPNQFEEGTKLVPPGNKVTGKDVSINVTLVPSSANSNQEPKADSGNPVVVSKKAVEYPVRNEETYEEYYRVFKEIRSILHENQTTNSTQTALGNFAKAFQVELVANRFNNLKTWGQDLWKLGYQFVQGIGSAAITDDRLLYYARLEAIAVLRNYSRRQNPSIALSDVNLNLFELSSRGLETDGTNAYIKFEAGETNRVVVTGFDPFQLYNDGNLLISNSSGLIALDRHQKPITAGKTFMVRTAILPVRFKDFDEGLIEKIMKKAVEDSELIMTCSWTPFSEFRIDRFAARYRIGGSPDNEGDPSKTTTNPFGATAPFFLESTLPYTAPGVLAKDKKVGSPNPIYLFLDQSFVQASHSHGEPTAGSPDSYQPITGSDLPKSEEMISGSGGNYLSNEIFYRTSNVRRSNRPTLPTGHLHAPTIGTTPEAGGPSLIKGAEEILASMLPYAVSLAGTVQIGFPNTLINSSGTTRTITIDVPANYPNEVKISSVEFSQSPSAFQIAPFSTITIQPGASAMIEVKFVPTEVKDYADTVNLKDPNGSVLQIVELKGKGIAPPTPLRITNFSPTSGSEGTMVTIYGEGFIDVADVRIGSQSVLFTVDSPTQITAEVTYGVRTGYIYVDTNTGTAQSATMFRISIRPPRDPYDPYNP